MTNMTQQNTHGTALWYGTTILAVRKAGKLCVIGDGQVSMGQTVMKGNARKVRRLAGGEIIAGFAGATADAFTLFERLEEKLERFPGQLQRAAVELAKDWRTEKYLQKLEALLIVAALGIHQYEEDAETIGRKAMEIAANICVYTNNSFTVETLES